MSDRSRDMGSNGRLADDEARGGIGTIARPATRQGGRPRQTAEDSAPAERRGRQGRQQVPSQRAGRSQHADAGQLADAAQRTAARQSSDAVQRTAGAQRTAAPEWPPPAHGGQEPQRTAAGRGSGTPRAAQRRAPQAGPGGANAAAGQHRGPFVVLLCGLLGGALVSALVISTTLAQGAFEISKLQDSTSALARQRQALAEEVAQAQSAQVIEQRALKLGMRPVGELRFLDLKTGRIRTDAAAGAMRNVNIPGYTP